MIADCGLKKVADWRLQSAIRNPQSSPFIFAPDGLYGSERFGCDEPKARNPSLDF
jgi:hypothetical protein